MALFEMHRGHVRNIPYETTWIHLGERWGVDQEDSLRRIAHRRRGGYCFQLNGAFALLLVTLGYDVTLHHGGVHGPDGPDAARMMNHLVVLVRNVPSEHNPDGSWYVDAGLGDGLFQPIPLRIGEFRQGPFTFGLARIDGTVADWDLTHDPTGSFRGMAFREAPARIEEFAARNTELSTAPESGFVKLVTAQRRDADGVDLLRGLVLHRIGTETAPERIITSEADWFDVLYEVFDLALDDVGSDDRHRLWERVSATHRTWQDSL